MRAVCCYHDLYTSLQMDRQLTLARQVVVKTNNM